MMGSKAAPRLLVPSIAFMLLIERFLEYRDARQSRVITI
jgi:hypothetical protein